MRGCPPVKRTLALWATVALFLGACAGGASSPLQGETASKQTLLNALRSLENVDGFDLTFSIQSTTDSLRALAADAGDDLSSGDAQKILSSSLSIVAKNTTDPAELATQMIVDIGGEETLELRAIHKDVFVRADVRGLLELSGRDSRMLDALRQQAAAAGAGFVGDVIDGEWIHLDGFEELAENMPSGGESEQPGAREKRLIEQFTTSLEANAAVTSQGEEDAGEHFVARVPLRETYASYVDLIGNVASALPAGAFPPETDIPDEDIALDVWVSEGAISQIELDLLQAGDISGRDTPQGVDQLAIRMTLDRFGGEVSAPEGAVTVTPRDVFSLFGGAGASLQG
jgi:hypothetical protein